MSLSVQSTFSHPSPRFSSALFADEESSFGVRASAIAAGRTQINVRITHAPDGTRLKGLTASLTLDVTEPLKLLSPSELLLAPSSHFHIRTNYDHDPQKNLVYKVPLLIFFPFLRAIFSLSPALLSVLSSSFLASD